MGQARDSCNRKIIEQNPILREFGLFLCLVSSAAVPAKKVDVDGNC